MEEYDASWDFDVLVFIPNSMTWEEAYQATKHLIAASKMSHLTNPHHWDKKHLNNPNFSWEGGYIWRLTMNFHKLPEGYRYLTEGEIIERTDIYWSLTNYWKPAYAVGYTWTPEYAIYARKI